MQTESKSVVVFGATSYLGQFVLANLIREGYKVIAVSRDEAKCSILLSDFLSELEIATLDEMDSLIARYGKPAGVINLAYVKDSPLYSLYRQNKRLMEKVHHAAKASSCERLIHISSQAVFGYAFDRPPQPADIATKLGDPYIEAKIHAEHLLREAGRTTQRSLCIVRLGNLIGPSAVPWIATLAQKILEGRAVGYRNGLGYSNATYSKNAADYVCFLLKQPREILDHFGIYHHLAEFCDTGWNKILEFLSSVIGKEFQLISPTDLNEIPDSSRLTYRLISRLKKGLAGGLVRWGANRFISEGFFGDVISLRLRQLYVAQPHIGSIEQIPAVDEFDKISFDILSEKIPFWSHVLPDWSAPIELEDALIDIKQWLKRAGYVIEKDQELSGHG